MLKNMFLKAILSAFAVVAVSREVGATQPGWFVSLSSPLVAARQCLTRTPPLARLWVYKTTEDQSMGGFNSSESTLTPVLFPFHAVASPKGYLLRMP